MSNIQFEIYKKYRNDYYIEYFPEDFCFRKNQENTYLTKYQEFVAEYFKFRPNQRGLLVYHELGSGKTLASINWARVMSNILGYDEVFIISSKILCENFIKETKKFFGNDIEFIKKIIPIDINKLERGKNIMFENSLIIIDEVQIFNDGIIHGNKDMVELYETIFRTKNVKILLLTATPILSNPFELSPLFNLLSGQELFPRDGYNFKGLYIDDRENTVYRKGKFKKITEGYISYYKGQKDDINIMAVNKGIQLIISRRSGNPEVSKLNDFYKEYEKKSKKIGNIFVYTENRNIISNILDNIKDSVYLDNEVDESILDKFNSPDNINGKYAKCLVVSSGSMFGISVFNVRYVFVMEPKNEFREFDQILGRCLRLCSHKDLPINKRNIRYYVLLSSKLEIQKYEASILYDDINSEFYNILQKNAIDRLIFEPRKKEGLIEKFKRFYS